MLGVLYGLLAGTMATGHQIKKGIENSTNQINAKEKDELYYRDANGIIRDTNTGQQCLTKVDDNNDLWLVTFDGNHVPYKNVTEINREKNFKIKKNEYLNSNIKAIEFDKGFDHYILIHNNVINMGKRYKDIKTEQIYYEREFTGKDIGDESIKFCFFYMDENGYLISKSDRQYINEEKQKHNKHMANITISEKTANDFIEFFNEKQRDTMWNIVYRDNYYEKEKANDNWFWWTNYYLASSANGKIIYEYNKPLYNK